MMVGCFKGRCSKAREYGNDPHLIMVMIMVVIVMVVIMMIMILRNNAVTGVAAAVELVAAEPAGMREEGPEEISALLVESATFSVCVTANAGTIAKRIFAEKTLRT